MTRQRSPGAMPHRFNCDGSRSRASANRFVTVPFAIPNDCAAYEWIAAQVTQQQYIAQRRRHSREFLVDDRPEVVSRFCRLHPFAFGRRHFSRSPPNGLTPKFLATRRATPCRHGPMPRPASASGPVGEDEEDHLEGVVGIGPIPRRSADSVHGARAVGRTREGVFMAFRQVSVRKPESTPLSCDPVQRSRICTSAAFDVG